MTNHLCHTPLAALCVAGVALGDMHLHFRWQAWHLVTSTFVLRGRHGTYGTGWLWWCAWTGLVAGDAAALCVAGVALGDIHLRFAWQARHLWHWLALVVRLDWISRRWRRGTLRGRRGTWRHPPSFHVAGVALGDIHLRFAWQARHLWHWAGSGGALGLD